MNAAMTMNKNVSRYYIARAREIYVRIYTFLEDFLGSLLK